MLSFCFANEKNDIIPKYPDKEVPIPSPHVPIAQAYRKKTLQSMGGWADLKTMQNVYIHTQEEDLENARRLLTLL